MAVVQGRSIRQAIEEHPRIRTVSEVPAELRERAQARGWPDGLLDRAFALRVPRVAIDDWLANDRIAAKDLARDLEILDEVFDGSLRVREATWRDGEALSDLYANAAETVGDWRLVVERGPNPYAQFRLQEHVNIQVVECRGVFVAAAAHACRNAFAGGYRIAVHFMSAWRVHDEFRGFGLSRMLQTAAGPGTAWFGPVTYWYERVGNASQGWLDKVRTMAESRDNRVDGLSATVHLLPPEGAEPLRTFDLHIRPIEPGDLPRCVELINTTHAGLDLFRPYSEEFLESHLDDPAWGPKPAFIPRVYGWEDCRVVEDAHGEVIACGGLWDRGRDVREVWTHLTSGAERRVASTALLDWGHAPGRADAMAHLIRHFLRRTHDLGRDQLLAPLEFAPDVLDALSDLAPSAETRALRCMGFNEGAVRIEPHLSRPYTDLAYW